MLLALVTHQSTSLIISTQREAVTTPVLVSSLTLGLLSYLVAMVLLVLVFSFSLFLAWRILHGKKVQSSDRRQSKPSAPSLKRLGKGASSLFRVDRKKRSLGSYIALISIVVGVLMILVSAVLTVSDYVSDLRLRDQYGVWHLDLYFALYPWVLAGMQIGCVLVIFALVLKVTRLTRMLSGPAAWWRLTLGLVVASLVVPNYVITQTPTVYGRLMTRLFTWIPLTMAYMPNAYIPPQGLWFDWSLRFPPFLGWSWIQGFLALLLVFVALSAYTLKSTGRMKIVAVLSALLFFTYLYLDYQVAPGWSAGSMVPTFTRFFFLFPFHEAFLALTAFFALKLTPLTTEPRAGQTGSQPPVESSMMFCRECGARIPRTSKYCGECGAKLIS
jgi:hypothetical protein